VTCRKRNVSLASCVTALVHLSHPIADVQPTHPMYPQPAVPRVEVQPNLTYKIKRVIIPAIKSMSNIVSHYTDTYLLTHESCIIQLDFGVRVTNTSKFLPASISAARCPLSILPLSNGYEAISAIRTTNLRCKLKHSPTHITN
jgi:hypothetical protein